MFKCKNKQDFYAFLVERSDSGELGVRYGGKFILLNKRLLEHVKQGYWLVFDVPYPDFDDISYYSENRFGECFDLVDGPFDC
jgi:hypothetical protein